MDERLMLKQDPFEYSKLPAGMQDKRMFTIAWWPPGAGRAYRYSTAAASRSALRPDSRL